MEQTKKGDVMESVIPAGVSVADFDALVSMCAKCRSIIKKHLFLKIRYFYFVTNEPEQVDIARNIFKKYGIIMDKHMSQINRTIEPQMVLRVKERNISKATKELLAVIEQKRTKLFNERFFGSVYGKNR